MALEVTQDGVELTESIVSLVVGLWTIAIGWSQLREGWVRKVFYRFNYGMVIAVFAIIAGLQATMYRSGASAMEGWQVAATFGFGALFMCLAFVLPFLTVTVCGAYLGLVIGTSVAATLDTLEPEDGDLLIEACGLIGLGFGAFAGWFNERFLGAVTVVLTGGCMVVLSLGCWFEDIPLVRPYAFALDDYASYEAAYECGQANISAWDDWAFLVLGCIIGVVGLLFQVVIGVVVRKVMAAKQNGPVRPKVFSSEMGLLTFVERVCNLCKTNIDIQEVDVVVEAHKDRLATRLDAVQKRVDNKFNAGQYFAVAKALKKKPRYVKNKVVQWLLNHEDWQPTELQNSTLSEDGKSVTLRSLFHNVPWETYCKELKQNSRHEGDYLTLIALVEVFNIEIQVITSLEGEEYLLKLSPDGPARERWEHERVQREGILAEQQPMPSIAPARKSRKGGGGDVESYSEMEAESGALFNEDDMEQLARDESRDRMPNEARDRYSFTEADERNAHLNTDAQFFQASSAVPMDSSESEYERDPTSMFDADDEDLVINGGEEERPRVAVWMYHCWKRSYGALRCISETDDLNEYFYDSDDELESSILESPTVMGSEESEMRACHPAGSRLLNKVLVLLVIVAGVWWLVWMPLWGQDWSNFWSVIGFLLFYLAEQINFWLGLVYQMNFLNAVTRRWKSLSQLSHLSLKPRVDCMIFHYTEEVAVTKNTLDGALKMQTNNGKLVGLNVYVCDDGFWQKCPQPASTTVQEVTRRCDGIRSAADYFVKLCSGSNRHKKAGYEVIGEEQAPGKGDGLLSDGDAEVRDPDHVVSPNEVSPRATFPKDVVFEMAEQKYNVRPSPMGLQMIRGIVQALRKHYKETTERLPNGQEKAIRVQWVARLSTSYEQGGGSNGLGIISRKDCALASLCISFRVVIPGEEKEEARLRPAVHLVARIKPKKHHNKSGNINNCLYNEIKPDKNRFVMFLDNDMRPEPLFLMRTLPFFFNFNNKKNLYSINPVVAFVQTPQYFTTDTLGPMNDFLASKNSIFFQAIQKGRDGFYYCAFAGTNAVFRAGAVYSIGGMPYGSVTEDALAGGRLHKAGYRSIYAEEKLAIGLAPTTVASAMKQRMRWCKGSVQILIMRLFGPPPQCELVFQPGLEPLPEDTSALTEKKKTRDDRITTEFMRKMFSLDTMLYPISAVTAICYMFVALLFVWTAKSPLTFTHWPYYWAFLFTFVPYFLVKFFCSLSAYSGKVDSEEIWISQQVWFGYAFSATFGIFDACRERLTGKGMSWGVTGESERRHFLEYFNLFMVAALCLGIVVRLIHMLFHFTESPLVDFGAIFFAGTIAFQMWPMVSMSLFEWIKNSAASEDEKQDMHRFEVPTYIIYIIALLLVIALGVIADNCSSEVEELYEEIY